MKTFITYFVIFIFSAMVSMGGNGQNTHIKGVVVDGETHEPLAGVNISLENNQYGIGTITNQKGEFRLWNLPHDTSNILISLNGYQTSLIDINSFSTTEREMKIIELDTKSSGNNKLQITENKKTILQKRKGILRK